MKNSLTPDNEFYVGYFPKAPIKIASATKRVIAILFTVMIGVAAIIALEQKQFSSANFEYGLVTVLDGYLFTKPVPHLQVPLGKDISNTELYQTILLVGSGKAGASDFIFSQSASDKKMEGVKVRLTGSLIYGHGKTLLQVEEASTLEYLEGKLAARSVAAEQEEISVSGEIVDPKCFFGVMKPGEGKSHRSCAIRCIAGGIPPVFKSDSSGYFLLVNENNEAVSSEIVNIVGDHISLTGVAVYWNDWTVLQVGLDEIRQLAAEKKWKENLISFETGMTQCN
jgi:hypothetical protein